MTSVSRERGDGGGHAPRSRAECGDWRRRWAGSARTATRGIGSSKTSRKVSGGLQDRLRRDGFMSLGSRRATAWENDRAYASRAAKPGFSTAASTNSATRPMPTASWKRIQALRAEIQRADFYSSDNYGAASRRPRRRAVLAQNCGNAGGATQLRAHGASRRHRDGVGAYSTRRVSRPRLPRLGAQAFFAGDMGELTGGDGHGRDLRRSRRFSSGLFCRSAACFGTAAT